MLGITIVLPVRGCAVCVADVTGRGWRVWGDAVGFKLGLYLEEDRLSASGGLGVVVEGVAVPGGGSRCGSCTAGAVQLP